MVKRRALFFVHLGLSAFNTVAEAKAETIFALCICDICPSSFAAEAIMEAVEAELDLLVCITEGIHNMTCVRYIAIPSSRWRRERRDPSSERHGEDRPTLTWYLRAGTDAGLKSPYLG